MKDVGSKRVITISCVGRCSEKWQSLVCAAVRMLSAGRSCILCETIASGM